LGSVMTDTSASDVVGYTHLALNIRLAAPQSLEPDHPHSQHAEHEEMQFVDAAHPRG